MPDLFIIDSSWQEQSWLSTGGTRAKRYLASPDGKYYYFKRSEYKPAKDGKPEKYYKYEFWSEIIAYQVGKELGFNVLKYDVAIDNNVVGCISQDMINLGNEQLIQGVQYLQSYDPEFEPGDYKNRKKYTFQLIEAAINQLTVFFAENFLEKMVEMFVLDAIIGNTDRHQENWAAINKYVMEDLPGYKQKVKVIQHIGFAPIYDSGSSLGRELEDEKVSELIVDQNKILAYISKGKSEVHWKENKISHFSFIQELLITEHKESIIKCIKRVQKLFNEERLSEIVNNIDTKIPDSLKQYKIPENRKALIMKLITLRIEKLGALIHERV